MQEKLAAEITTPDKPHADAACSSPERVGNANGECADNDTTLEIIRQARPDLESMPFLVENQPAPALSSRYLFVLNTALLL